MNKSQIILASIGGAVGIAALVFAWLIWDAYSSKAESAEALDDNLAAAQRIVSKLSVKPVKSALEVYTRGAADYDDWRTGAFKAVSAGDLVFEKTTAPSFKAFLVSEAHRLSGLPGGVEGKIVKPDFPFGFKDYITGGKLPAENDLPRLQREWSDVALVVEELSKAGVIEISDVKLGVAKVEQKEEEQPKRRGKSRKQAKGGEEESAAEGPAVTSAEVVFLARPPALVKAVNAFATCPRFVVVDDFSFVRSQDALAEVLGGDAKKQDQQASSSRRRRRGARAADAVEEKEEEKTGPVTEPSKEAPLKVVMKLSVYDFRTLETAKEETTEEEK